MATVFNRFKANANGFTSSKGPAWKYAARRLFKEKIAKMKSGALELTDENGNVLEEFATPDMQYHFQTIGTEDCDRRRADAYGLPMPEPKSWRKSY